MPAVDAILEVRGLKTYFRGFEGTVKAVDDISFSLEAGKILALVGESGCGKSVTAQTLMGLHSSSRTIIEGSVLYKGEEILGLSRERFAGIRGTGIAMSFQEPMSAFDPLYSIGRQMTEAYTAHARVKQSEARRLAVRALTDVGIADADRRIDEYPHQMSGGMLQRVLIAIAIMNRPGVLIADEPTTALDVTIQAQVIRLMREVQRETGMSVIFITHDLGIVAEIADDVHVMYAGRIVEKAPVGGLFGRPRHPYTIGLLASKARREDKGGKLAFIPGSVPRAWEFPDGCRFHPRCPRAMPRCSSEVPPLFGRGHECACWLFDGEARA